MSRFDAAVEGNIDEAIVRRLAHHLNRPIGTIYGRNGKPWLRGRLRAYNETARRSPWLVLIDLDNDAPCAPKAREQWLPKPAKHMCFRIAVHQVEAWLLADRKNLSEFLGVALSKITTQPESLSSPKNEILSLARRSSRREIREGIDPAPQSGRIVGPLYASLLREFVSDSHEGWRPDVAARSSDSLARTLSCIRRIT